MPLALGTHLGAYEILAPLGVGGMGEVFRARDTSLGRDVAVKILRSGSTHDSDRLRRFRQEAQSAASLNHPNILAIYFVGEYDGAPFIVSELLEGESLRERLRGGTLLLRKSLDYASQIVEGLAAAHEKGIVHRDLKPENIFLTKDGRVKILDFGLAKLLAPGETATDPSAVTLTQGSAPGVVLGTAGYMSPEQVRGQPLDTRSDIFSFGVVLYEMLSGKNVFLRSTPADTMSALLREDAPELSSSSAAVSPGLDRVVRRCLEKEPVDRFQSVRDLGFALQAVSAGGTSSSTPVLPLSRKVPVARALLAAAAFAAIPAAYFVGQYRAARATSPQPQFQQLTFMRGSVQNARFAPDGQTIIYGARIDGLPSRLYATHIGSPESQTLQLNNVDLLSVSPTGELAVLIGCASSINPLCSATLARMPFSGGAPREVAQHVVVADWLPDGKEMAAVLERGGHYLVEFPVGRSVYDTTAWISTLRVSPNGKYVAVTWHPQLGNDAGSVIILDASGHEVTSAGPWNGLQGLAWSPNGQEVWFSGSEGNESWADQIRAVSLSGKQRRLLRLPGFTRLHEVAHDGRILLSKDEPRAQLMFVGPNDTQPRDLSWLDLSQLCDLSQDGKTVIFSEVGAAGGNTYLLYLRKTDGSPAVRLGEGFKAAMSPDGLRVLAFTAENPERVALISTGVGGTTFLPNSNLVHYSAPGWTPDGKQTAFTGTDGHGWRFFLQDLEGGAPPRAVTPEIGATNLINQVQLVSPDGKFAWSRDAESNGWLYFLDGSSGSRKVQGLLPEEALAGWGSDNRSVFIYRPDVYPLVVYRLDFLSGERKKFKELIAKEPVGLSNAVSVRVSKDGRYIAYSYQQRMSDLYLVTDLK
jgi:eukaryotic-like serine/threonine-protein kinase